MSASRVIEVSFGNETVVYVNIDTAYYYNDGVIIKPTDGDLPDTYQVHWADSPEAQTTLETIGTSEGVPVPDELWGRSKVIYGWFYLHPTEDSSVTYKEIRIYKSARAGLPDGTEPTPSEHSTIDQLISAMNTAADKAEQNADSASSDADRAETARNEAETYAVNAQTSASNAEASATTATNQAQIATASATTATTAAQTATAKATEASNSASSAAESASSASDSADSASRSEQAAKISETNAADSESNASTYANSARGYAQTAQSASASASSSATSASNSATSASNSATSASQSAGIATEAKADIEGMVDDAQGYAESASQSASASAQSASASANSASDAQGYANSASASAQSASGYASNAQTSANTASAKATEASTSAQTASQKATEASQSASQALSYKTDAEQAKTASQTAQGLAESARDSAVQAKTDAESAKADAESARDEAQQAVASISGALAEKAPVITDTASGAIASFSDGADDLPLKSLVVNIDPIQDLHGQDSPYPAGGGKNLLQTTAQSKTENGVTWTVNADGTIVVSGTATGYTDMEVGYARVSSNMGMVTISGISTATNIAWGPLTVRDVNDNVLYTITSGGTTAVWSCDLSQYPEAYSIRVFVKRNNNVVTSGTVKIQVEKGSTATDWTPYENICPISGWTEVQTQRTGVNISDKDATWTSAGNYILNDNGVQVPDSNSSYFLEKINVKPSTSFYIYGGTSVNGIQRLYYFDKDGSFIGRSLGIGAARVETVPSNCHYLGFQYQKSTLDLSKWSINYPSTDHDYHHYTGTSITINLGQTVYGGKLDVLSGELVITHKGVDMGALSWSMQAGEGTQFSRFLTLGIASDVSRVQTDAEYPVMLDLKAPILVPHSNPVYSRIIDNAMCVLCSTGGFYATCSVYTSASDFKTAVTGMMLVYKLATPIEIQLSVNQINSLYGTNNLWADSGDTTAEYRADTKLFIERLTAPDSADMIADANITSGQYFMVGNSLYKATANIANGAQIIVGTNCTRKSLSEALNEINA